MVQYVKSLISAFDELIFNLRKIIENDVSSLLYNDVTGEVELLGFVLICFLAISLFIILLTFISNALRFK